MSASPSSVLAAAILAAGISGCSSSDPPSSPPPPPPPPPGPTVAIAKAPTASGDGQTAVVATSLSNPLRVVVTEDGSSVAGRTVTWSTTSGSVTSSSTTDATGIATSQWTLGQSAGPQTASAALSGAGGSPVGFTATASAGAAVSIAKGTGDAQSGFITTVLANPLFARAADQFGNPVGGVSIMWQEVPPGGTTFSPASSNTGSDGQVQTSVTLGTTVGPISIQAVSTGLTGSPLAYTATALTLPMAVSVQLSDVALTFSPADVTIAAGGTVTWNWPSTQLDIHNVMPDATEPVRSGDPVVGPGSYQFIFNTPGTYMYYFFVHGAPGGSGMSGTVTVL